MSEASKKQGPNEQAGPETGGARSKGEEQEVFVISVAAEITGMHAQTLRTYDRMGLVTPQRTRGGGRRYSRDDIAQLLEIQRLSHEEGVNLAGIQRIIELEEQLQAAQQENAVLRQQLANARGESRGRSRGEIVHVPRSTAVVLWEQRRKR
ncbi:helix-turn-helix transcriptional regulator [Corynebacterium sp. UMB9976]|uniref:heat shock protein transcriptional repressor HspR n=1 Tax=Corynebacterium sp. UMB9976 TaxID=3046354 RepID=UPI00254D4547|nr:helix-turn-helix transcriptional regulator [Corynebacterium sp. UMB9976]MDK6301657.1 helix-turn-helix transcriptional regulator [Corynebacterium sp. UMB9976]